MNETIITKTEGGHDVTLTITPEKIYAELALDKFGVINTEVHYSIFRGRNVFRGEAPDKTTLFIALPQDVIDQALELKSTLRKNEEERVLPGINKLRDLTTEWNYADEQNKRAWNNIENDAHGYKPLKATEIYKELEEARKKYPRAALALVAENYQYASDDRKVTAGKKALELLKNGGTVEAAQAILDNWLPERAMWN